MQRKTFLNDQGQVNHLLKTCPRHAALRSSHPPPRANNILTPIIQNCRYTHFTQTTSKSPSPSLHQVHQNRPTPIRVNSNLALTHQNNHRHPWVIEHLGDCSTLVGPDTLLLVGGTCREEEVGSLVVALVPSKQPAGQEKSSLWKTFSCREETGQRRPFIELSEHGPPPSQRLPAPSQGTMGIVAATNIRHLD